MSTRAARASADAGTTYKDHDAVDSSQLVQTLHDALSLAPREMVQLSLGNQMMGTLPSRGPSYEPFRRTPSTRWFNPLPRRCIFGEELGSCLSMFKLQAVS
jgi:predicted alpha/beta hydrolase